MPTEFTIAAKDPLWLELLKLFITVAVPAIAALAGVSLSNNHNEKRAKREATERETVRLAELQRQEAVAQRDRALSAIALSEVLEDFAMHCGDVVSSQGQVRWEDPYTVAEYSHAEPTWLEDFPTWPDEVDWRSIGVELAQECAALRRASQFALADVQADADHLDMQDLHESSAEKSIKLGLRSWDLAIKVRLATGLPPFEGDGFTPAERLQLGEARFSRKNAKRRAAIAALSTKPSDSDAATSAAGGATDQ